MSLLSSSVSISTIHYQSQDPYFRLAVIAYLWISGEKRWPTWFIWPDPSLLRIAQTERLSGLLYFFYQSIDSSILPSSIQDQVYTQWLNQCATSMHRSTLLNEIWKSDWPTPLFIKGSDYEHSLDPGMGFRHPSDWDFIVPSEMYSEIISYLQKNHQPLSYPSTFESPKQSPYSVGFYLDDFLFEVHRDPAPQYSTLLTGDLLYKRASNRQSSSLKSGLLPCDEDRLWIWVINFAKGGGLMALSNWIDLSLILAKIFQISPFRYLNLKQKTWLHQLSKQWELDHVWLVVEALYTDLIDCFQRVKEMQEASALTPKSTFTHSTHSQCPHPLRFPHPYHQQWLMKQVIQWRYTPSSLKINYLNHLLRYGIPRVHPFFKLFKSS